MVGTGRGTSLGGFAPRLTTSLPALPRAGPGASLPDPLIAAASSAPRAPGPLPGSVPVKAAGTWARLPGPLPNSQPLPSGKHSAPFPIHGTSFFPSFLSRTGAGAVSGCGDFFTPPPAQARVGGFPPSPHAQRALHRLSLLEPFLAMTAIAQGLRFPRGLPAPAWACWVGSQPASASNPPPHRPPILQARNQGAAQEDGVRRAKPLRLSHTSRLARWGDPP